MKKLTLCLLLSLGVIGTSFAGRQIVDYKAGPAPLPEACFNDREFQIDIFGAFQDGNGHHHAGPIRESGWGGGVALNYFVSRHIGLGADALWIYDKQNAGIDSGVSKTTFHQLSGSLIFRLPIDEACLAPYAYIGGGFQVDGAQWASAHTGVGVEFRVVPQRVGLFADGRWTYFGDRNGNGDQNNFTARAGVRFVF